MGLCKYKDALGEPGKGVHTHFMGIAWIIATIIGGILLSILLLFITFLKTQTPSAR